MTELDVQVEHQFPLQQAFLPECVVTVQLQLAVNVALMHQDGTVTVQDKWVITIHRVLENKFLEDVVYQ